MYTIEKQEDEKFALLKDGEKQGEFASLEDAEKAQKIAEGDVQTGSWVDDGAGLEYPKESDDFHSGKTKLTGEERLNGILTVLHDKHGYHFPLDIFDPETDRVY